MKKSILFGLVLLLCVSFASAAITDNNLEWLSIDDSKVDVNNIIGELALYNATNNGLTTGVAGILRQAAFNNQDTKNISWNNLAPQLDQSTGFTSLWIKVHTVPPDARGVLTFDDGTNTDAWRIEARNDAGSLKFYFIMRDGSATSCNGFFTDALSLDTWYHIIVSGTGTNIDFYLDGVYKEQRACTDWWDDITPLSAGALLNTPYDGARGLNATIDEVSVWESRAIDDDGCSVGNTCGGEVATLYNSGSAYNPYYVPTSYSEITAKNIYNSSSIYSFSALLTNSSGTTSIHTSNGTIYFLPDLTMNVTVYNVTGGTYFNRSYLNWNTSTNLESKHWQSVLILDAEEKITGSAVPVFNATVGTQFNTSNSTDYTTFYLNAGSYSISGRAENYSYNATGSITLSALETATDTLVFAPNKLEMYIEDYFTNATITNFTIQVSSGSYVENVTDVAGTATFYGTNASFNLTTFKSGYSDESATVDLSNSSQNYTFYLFESNSIYVRIYNQDTGALITENVTVTFITDDDIFERSTINGTYFETELPEDVYTLTFESANYSKAYYQVTLESGTSQLLNAYLITNNVTTDVTFEIQDLTNTNLKLENATVSVSRIVDSVWVLINSLISDITGRVQFTYEPDEEYCFVITKTGYVTKTFCLNPILFDSYTIKLQKDYEQANLVDYSGISLYFEPHIFYNNAVNNLTFYFSSPSGNFDIYGYNITYKTTTKVGTGTNAYGEQFENTINITGASWTDLVTIGYYYETTYGERKDFSFSFYVTDPSLGNNTFAHLNDRTYGMGLFERTLISVGLGLLVAGGTFMFVGAIPAAAMTVLVYGFLINIGFMELWTGVLSIIVLLSLMFWGSAR